MSTQSTVTPSRYSSTTDAPYVPDPPPDTRPYRVLVQVGSRLEWRRVGMRDE